MRDNENYSALTIAILVEDYVSLKTVELLLNVTDLDKEISIIKGIEINSWSWIAGEDFPESLFQKAVRQCGSIIDSYKYDEYDEKDDEYDEKDEYVDLEEKNLIFALNNNFDAIAKVLAIDLIENENCQFRKKDRDGNTSLMICLKAKKLMLFELIVNSPRVDVTIEDNDGNSVLSFALRYKMDEYAERLFAKMQNEPPPSTQETGNQGKLDC